MSPVSHTRKLISEWLLANLTPFILVCWGLLHIGLYFSGIISTLLHAFFRPIALVAGIILLVLAIIWPFLGKQDCDTGCEKDHHHECHENNLGMFLKATILLVPVFLYIWIRPVEYTSSTIQNRGIQTSPVQLSERSIQGDEIFSFEAEPLIENLPNVLDANVSELLYLADDPALRKKFEGREVSVIGQYMPDPSLGGVSYKVVRLLMTCCAADAMPVGVRVFSNVQPVNVKHMDWVIVVGILNFDSYQGRLSPRITEKSIKQTEPPREIFLY